MRNLEFFLLVLGVSRDLIQVRIPRKVQHDFIRVCGEALVQFLQVVRLHGSQVEDIFGAVFHTLVIIVSTHDLQRTRST